MITEATRYCVAVYHDEDTEAVYTRAVIAWANIEGRVQALVYNDFDGLEPCDTDGNFIALNFEPKADLNEFVGEYVVSNMIDPEAN